MVSNETVYHNHFRGSLREGKVLIGCWSQLASPITAEVLGLAGFDWILFDGEHGPNDVVTFIPQLMALKGSRSASVVRPPFNDPVIIKRLLDIGFYNFIVPLVNSREDAQRAVASTRYPTAGIRGVAVAHRSNMYGTFADYHTTINDEISVTVQIETVNAVKNIDAICAVDGVDAIFVGPSDLSAAMGYLGDSSHIEVQKTIAHLFARARAIGKACGTLAPVEADARRYLDMGATLVAVGSDIGLFKAATFGLREKFIKL
ncbi:MAG TPA: 2-dehydro-3-deoxyglucarate aldolase [Syntrophorhabdaceae bacterium]|nr:2-dehydro-3-deoxyglucarate aldolase [Syntrophorhabdaceae bacterium]